MVSIKLTNNLYPPDFVNVILLHIWTQSNSDYRSSSCLEKETIRYPILNIRWSAYNWRIIHVHRILLMSYPTPHLHYRSKSCPIGTQNYLSNFHPQPEAMTCCCVYNTFLWHLLQPSSAIYSSEEIFRVHRTIYLLKETEYCTDHRGYLNYHAAVFQEVKVKDTSEQVKVYP